ncbi:hypothetical protein OROGR_018532 [Orobanche gracilis]
MLVSISSHWPALRITAADRVFDSTIPKIYMERCEMKLLSYDLIFSVDVLNKQLLASPITLMDGLVDEVTLEEFKIFYGIDRELYTILVCHLSHNPSECLLIMGFWLWLERVYCCNIISKILSLDPLLIDMAYDEALTFLQIIISNHLPTPSSIEVPLTRRLLKTDVSFQYLRENRRTVLHHVQNLISDVCILALSDIMELARNDGIRESPDQNATPVLDRPTPLVRALTYDDLIAHGFLGLQIEGDSCRAHTGEAVIPRFTRTVYDVLQGLPSDGN